jgi:hypothetical protein
MRDSWGKKRLPHRTGEKHKGRKGTGIFYHLEGEFEKKG